MLRSFIIAALLSSTYAAHATDLPYCHRVRGHYSIYVGRDSLIVEGSKHYVNVTDDALDRELEKRGWQNTTVYGYFSVCAVRNVAPQVLTLRDQVELKGYDHLRFVTLR